jgi:alkylated DNA repair protein alkB homolog 1
LLSRRSQVALLDKLLHRDLSNPLHKTNLHHHHNFTYPEVRDNSLLPSSFFAASPDTVLPPKDRTIHKPFTYRQMLESKLRWITLGGQYDWTNKVYPDTTPPPFPPDAGALLKRLFPSIEAQAAIVNFYSPGDTLSVHRDVSEQCDRDLVSISFGCDGIFVVGDDEGMVVEAIRLRSGDAILLSGPSRYAWHGVPRVLADTCPAWLRDWPAHSGDNTYQQWQGWMNNKRINLNVRQVTETTLPRLQELV